MTVGFHEVQFPTNISQGSKGGPQRMTDVVTLRSGGEQRNSIWAGSRRKYQAGYGVRTFEQAQAVTAFFEERRGRLYGFRWKDWSDFQSSQPGQAIAATDQVLGTGDGTTTKFQLLKTYGANFAPWSRVIGKPVSGTVAMGIGGAAQAGSAFTVDTTTGVVTFVTAPAFGTVVTAGFQFDVPVRFDTDYIELTMTGATFADYSAIPIIEIKV